MLVKSNSRTRKIYGLRQIRCSFLARRGYGQSSEGVNNIGAKLNYLGHTEMEHTEMGHNDIFSGSQ